MRSPRSNFYGNLAYFFLVAAVVLLTANCAHGQKSVKKQEEPVITEAELQSQVMGFADRFAAYISQGFEDYDVLDPPLENRRIVQGDAVYSMYAAFIIAAEADPDAALLDMVVMVTLGRMIYEEHWREYLGPPVDSMIRAFKKSEKDIWNILTLVLNSDQQKELYALIEEWRQNHPEELQFSYLRVSDFAADRARSKLARIWQPSGLFKSVEVATKQVEEARLLAERAMFLATRVPLLSGYFADVWASQLLISPELKDLLSDLHRFVDVAEKLPDNIARERQLIIEQALEKLAAERQAAIRQALDGLARERKQTIDDFLAQEVRIKGILTELKQTVTEGNKLLVSANTLADQLNLGASTESSEDAEPFNINDYKETVAEATITVIQLNALVESMDQLLNSAGMEKLLPRLHQTIDRAGDEGEKLIDHSFRQGVLLLMAWVLAYVVARLLAGYLSDRFFRSKSRQ
jgi:hypothetical protein